MNINWKVRIQQKWFWITLIPLLFLAIDQMSELIATFIVYIDTYTLGAEIAGSALEVVILRLVGSIFAIAALIGFPVDLTTNGYGDGVIGLSYEEPAPNAAQVAVAEYKAEVRNDD